MEYPGWKSTHEVTSQMDRWFDLAFCERRLRSGVGVWSERYVHTQWGQPEQRNLWTSGKHATLYQCPGEWGLCWLYHWKWPTCSHWRSAQRVANTGSASPESSKFETHLHSIFDAPFMCCVRGRTDWLTILSTRMAMATATHGKDFFAVGRSVTLLLFPLIPKSLWPSWPRRT